MGGPAADRISNYVRRQALVHARLRRRRTSRTGPVAQVQRSEPCGGLTGGGAAGPHGGPAGVGGRCLGTRPRACDPSYRTLASQLVRRTAAGGAARAPLGMAPGHIAGPGIAAAPRMVAGAGMVLMGRGGPGAMVSLSEFASVVPVGAGPTRMIAATDIASRRTMNASVASSTRFSMSRLKTATRPFSADRSRVRARRARCGPAERSHEIVVSLRGQSRTRPRPIKRPTRPTC
jgi:hypothetical protein